MPSLGITFSVQGVRCEVQKICGFLGMSVRKTVMQQEALAEHSFIVHNQGLCALLATEDGLVMSHTLGTAFSSH